MTVTDDELRAEYEKRKAEYHTAERRTIEQITFPTVAEARQAKDRIAAGADFLVVAKERGLSQKDASLGDVRASDIADDALATAAFALAEGAVSDPVQGRLSVSLVRVTGITPATTRTFEEVRGDLLGQDQARKGRGGNPDPSRQGRGRACRRGELRGDRQGGGNSAARRSGDRRLRPRCRRQAR